MFIENVNFNKAFCDELYDKKDALNAHKNEIETLVIGGSHLNYSVNPKYFDSLTLNFCFSSMDLFATWHLIDLYGEKMPKLKNIVTRIGIFSPGYDLSKTGENWRCFYYKEILGVPYDIDGTSPEFQEYKKQLSQRKIDDDFFGYKTQTWFGSWNAKERYQGHLKNFCRNDTSLKYLSLIDKWCFEHKKRLIIIITPHRSDYIAESSKSIMRLLGNYVREYAPYSEFYSFFDDSDFKDDDFGDTDHMKESGCETLSRKLNVILNTKPKTKKWKLPRYLFKAFIINLPFIRCFVKYDYLLKTKRKIQKYWY